MPFIATPVKGSLTILCPVKLSPCSGCAKTGEDVGGMPTNEAIQATWQACLSTIISHGASRLLRWERVFGILADIA